MTFGLKNWMTELDGLLKNIPLIRLAIPGLTVHNIMTNASSDIIKLEHKFSQKLSLLIITEDGDFIIETHLSTHDSMTYSITQSSPVAPDSEEVVKLVSKYFCCTKKIIYKWCITQNATVLHQLNMGIRYFDLRLATKPPEQEFYFVHGLYASPINSPLREINSFLMENGEEIVILDFQHFYDFSSQNHQMLLQEIWNLFQDKICPAPLDLTVVTLNWMKKHNYQVIIIYRNDIFRNDRKVWPGQLWPTPWPDTTDTQTLINFLTEKLKNRCNDVGLVTQCILTPDIKFVLKHLWGGLEHSCAACCYRVSLPWLCQQTPGLNGINVVITDFFNKNGEEFSKTVIDLNYKFIKK